MSIIIHGVKDIGDVRLLLDGEKPLNDDLFEIALSGLRSKFNLVSILRIQYPELVTALLGTNSSPYYKG